MMWHWDEVEPVFGRTQEEWRERIELIARVRNPLAHNRRAGTSPVLMEQFRKACREVLDWRGGFGFTDLGGHRPPLQRRLRRKFRGLSEN